MHIAKVKNIKLCYKGFRKRLPRGIQITIDKARLVGTVYDKICNKRLCSGYFVRYTYCLT